MVNGSRMRRVSVKILRIFPWIYILWLLSLVYGTHGTLSADDVPTFKSTQLLNRMAVDDETDIIYVGAVNRIFQLNTSLRLLLEEKTGPRNDSMRCGPPHRQCPFTKKSTDNYNKVLVIDKVRSKLITCGSTYQGACEVRNLSFINKFTPYYENDDIKNYAVAANTPNGSTVAFIAPGPSRKVLYVATTYTGKAIEDKGFRDSVPAIASRNLRRANRFALENEAISLIQKSSALYLKSDVRSTYPINYVTGFYSNGYSYFISTQRNSAEDPQSPEVTKIIQICQKDDFYNSYIDMPVKCETDHEVYDVIVASATIRPGSLLFNALNLDVTHEVLVGVFTKQDSSTGVWKSAVCVYSMPKIINSFVKNAKNCYGGDTSVSGGGYLNVGSDGTCDIDVMAQVRDMENDFFLCNQHRHKQSLIVGNEALSSSPVLVYPKTKLTAINLTNVDKYTVAFLGTSTGHLKKVVIETDFRAYEYSSEPIFQNERIKALLFDSKAEHVYAMSDYQIKKVKAQECGQHKNCSSCLKNKNPYCGWCLLETRCTLKSHCPGTLEALRSRWLHGGGGENQCVHITNVNPQAAAVTQEVVFYLTINELPDRIKYNCVFVDFNWSTPARRWGFGLQCTTPNVLDMGFSLGGQGYKVVTIGVNSSEAGHVFLRQSFTFYNCSHYQSCSQCTDTDFHCEWCIYDNKCTHNSTMCIEQQTVGWKKQSGTGKKGPNHCPQINYRKTSRIYLHDGLTKRVIIKGVNLPNVKPPNYKCLVNARGQVFRAPGSFLDSENVLCDFPAVEYPRLSSGAYNASLTLVWGNDFKIEDREGLTATIYNCQNVGQKECGLCKSINYTSPEMKCTWCGGTCIYDDWCKNHNAVDSSCPAPLIESVYPLTGPTGGGTHVTINGKELGSKFEDIKLAVRIADIPCDPVRELYSPSQRIVCKAGWSGETTSGLVVVTVAGIATKFRLKFSYQDPQIYDVNPKIGPKSGGTMITIQGKNLTTGNNVTALVGGKDCKMIKSRLTDRQAVCITPPMDMTQPITWLQTVSMKFDGQKKRDSNEKFLYIEDPTILEIAPLKSVASGGLMQTIRGTNFHGVQKPYMFAWYNETINGQLVERRTDKTDCKSISEGILLCPTPSVLSRFSRRRRRREVAAVKSMNIGFEMDNVQSVQRLDYVLEYFPDPVVFNFTGRVKKFKGEVLILEGKDLISAARTEDYSVHIGRERCNITSVSNIQIVCKVPLTQPNGIDASGREIKDLAPTVLVKVANLVFDVGKVEYSREKFQFPIEAIIGVAAAGGFLVLVIILILIIYRRQNTKAERIYKKLQIQLDSLESNVRNECKQAFAELQTDMTDMTSDLMSGGIPYWDYHVYTFKVLFPGMSDHAILHPPIKSVNCLDFTELGLQNFHHLLNNKNFLMKFIHTLEEQKSFGIRDKVNVASLLMVIFQCNLEYTTDILKSLLNELVEKSVQGKHPKLMLRRTESVVEKLLTNWLSLCLYKYLKDNAGPSLFVLYKAIKLQVEKGPVDAVSGDARYSLSEDRLLREKIEPKTLTLKVEHQGEMAYCKVLDCDTVDQAIEKLIDVFYKNIPFSQRPIAQELDLEWRYIGGHMTLQSDDVTTLCRDGWKKLNTLEHYKVQDGATMMLLMKHQYETIKSLNGSSTLPFMKSDHHSGSTKYWHLVKQDEGTVKDGGLKMISEIYLTRLLSTKGTLQKYVDDFFRTILSANSNLPPVVKYLFDYLDDAAAKHGITDTDAIHTWKCNSLLLRFWVNIIKNPNFVFDINKPNIVDSCLSVVAQTFMDSCSTSDHRLGKDSPTNKLLFARDIPAYKKFVERFFQNIQDLPPISDQDMNTYLLEVSKMCSGHFYVPSALRELYAYVSKYDKELMAALDEDNVTFRLQLSAKLGQVITAMEGPRSDMPGYV